MAGPAFTLPHDDDGIAPYPGLRPFKKHESLLFFGRDRCLDGMAETLQNQRFLAVLGPSGSGKSSLVRSGLFPHLEAGLARKAGSRWTFIDIQHPRCRPYRAMAKATLADEALRSGHDLEGYEDASDTLIEFSEDEIASREAELRRDPMSFARWWKERPRHPDENLLLLVDQFEELFGYSSPRERDEVETFVDLLLVTASNVEAPIYVVLTMRSEFLGGCSLFDGFAEAINRSLSLTPRMTRAECEIAITGPAFGRPGLELDPRLVNSLLNDMNSMAAFDNAAEGTAEADSQTDADMRQADLIARRADQLPLMQHVLNWLWARAMERRAAAGGGGSVALTLEDYHAVGGLRGALTQHANEVLGDDPDDIRVAERLFRAIIDQPSVARGSAETSAVRRPRRLEDIAHEAGADIAELSPLIERFRADGVSMLTPDPAEELGPQTEIDISHESIIRQWDLLRGWIRDEAEAGRGWQELLRSRTEEGRRGVLQGVDLLDRQAWWKRHSPHAGWAERYGGGFDEAAAFLARSERRAKRRRAMLLGGTAATFALAVASGLFLVSAQNQALAARAEAERVKALSDQTQVEANARLDTARREIDAAKRQKADAERKAEQARQEIILAKLASEQARREKDQAESAARLAQEQRIRLAQAATRSANVVLGVSRNMIDDAGRMPPASSEKGMDFADRMIPSLAEIDPVAHRRILYQRDVLRARNAYLDLDMDGLTSIARSFDTVAKDEGQTDWGAAARLNAALARGRAAALAGDFAAADLLLAEAASEISRAQGRVPADTDVEIAGQRARLRLGREWDDILTAATDAGSWKLSGQPGRSPPDLDSIRTRALPDNFVCPDPVVVPVAEDVQQEQMTDDQLRRLAFAPYPVKSDARELAAVMCSTYASLAGRPAEAARDFSWREVADRFNGINSSRDEGMGARAALLVNQKRRGRGPLSLSMAAGLIGSEFVNPIASELPLGMLGLPASLERSCDCPGKYSSSAALQGLHAAAMLYEPAAFREHALMLEQPNLDSDELTWFHVDWLRGAEEALRSSDAAQSNLPYVRSLTATELASATEAYLLSLESTLGESSSTEKSEPAPLRRKFDLGQNQRPPKAEGASRKRSTELDGALANLVEVAAQSIAWRAHYALASPPGDGRDVTKVIADAERLLRVAGVAPGILFYDSNRVGMRRMVDQVCQMAGPGRDCDRVETAFTGLSAKLVSGQAAAGPGWKGLVDGNGVALSGLDPVELAREQELDGTDSFSESVNAPGSVAAGEVVTEVARLGNGKTLVGREGLPAQVAETGQTIWLFADDENRRKFEANPKSFIPQVGGYDVAALFTATPSLVPVKIEYNAYNSGLQTLHYKGMVFYLGGEVIDEANFNDAAVAYALDVYAKLTDPAFQGAIERYAGPSPLVESALDGTSGTAGTVFR
jgi:hypothetical protein